VQILAIAAYSIAGRQEWVGYHFMRQALRFSLPEAASLRRTSLAYRCHRLQLRGYIGHWPPALTDLATCVIVSTQPPSMCAFSTGMRRGVGGDHSPRWIHRSPSKPSPPAIGWRGRSRRRGSRPDAGRGSGSSVLGGAFGSSTAGRLVTPGA
jgi:hypothetical protein